LNRLNVVIRPAAKRDMARYYGWLAGEAGADVAERFMSAADSSFGELAINPGLGAEIGSQNLRLARMRKWRIDGFPRMIVFYIPTQDTHRVVRVLNSVQDWWSLLDIG
jgi:toxin ParE1/3/4